MRRELGIEPSHLILLATHNHNAPIQINPDNFAYGHRLAEQMFGLIEEAIAAEQGPARVGFGSGDGYFITSRGNAPVDYEIQLLQVTRGDAPIAMLFSHGTHPAQASRSLIDTGYKAFPLKGSITLAKGRILNGMKADAEPDKSKEEMPVVWVRSYKSKSGKEGRVFTSTHGASEDIVNEGFRRMLVNGALWCCSNSSRPTTVPFSAVT